MFGRAEMALEVRDHLSNTPEHIEALARALGRGDRLAVFKAIYHHKKRYKSVGEIAKMTGLSNVRVLQCGKDLVQMGFVDQDKVDGSTVYRMIGFFQRYKRKVLGYVKNPAALEKLKTKRSQMHRIRLPKTVVLSTKGARVRQVYIDDIETFSKVRLVRSGGSLSPDISEDQFKVGVQAIIGEAGQFKDWGGENCDLSSTRLTVRGRRCTAAFAFKGPGERGVLVPGRMGKNGDQIQRMFGLPATVFFVQHWREIKDSVLLAMRTHAVAKSVANGGEEILYGIIDGQDSERLRKAYPRRFEKLG